MQLNNMETNSPQKKLLLIVDPQIDFISGSLPVPGAAEAMKTLAEYVTEHGCDYAAVAVTSDWHPFEHCSFDIHGGPWPVHCLQHSAGAAIDSNLLHSLCTGAPGFKVVYKGNDPSVEEYSIFMNPESSKIVDGMVTSEGIEEIDICGLAGDVCVLNTYLDAKKRYGCLTVNVLQEYSPSLDGGSKLREALE